MSDEGVVIVNKEEAREIVREAIPQMTDEGVDKFCRSLEKALTDYYARRVPPDPERSE